MAKGWLDNFGKEDNYNDSQTTAPKGFEGDGYSNVGRTFSPAWGGQFQEGGEIPNAQIGKKVKYVESKNDPRYKAYQDSLSLYNKGIKEEKEYNNFIKKNNIPKKVTRQWNNPVDDDNNINTKIEPIQGKGFIYNHNPNVISGTNIPAKLSNNRVMVYKKPQQQVIVKPKEVKPKEKLVPLQPMSRGLINTDQQINNADINIPVQARVPQYYNIQDINNQNFGGGDTSYRVDNLSDLRELPKEQWERKVTPQFQMGGSVYPVNYVPQAQDGEIIGDAGQELVDYLQRYSRYTKGMPGIGSAIGITQSLSKGEDMKTSDELGLFPMPMMQAASLTALYAEKEKQNLEDYAKRNLKNNGLPKLMKEKTDKETINNKRIDNTYVPKPKLDKIAEDSPKNKNTKLPYKEKKEVNKVQIDNTKTVKPRIDSNYKINSTPNSTLNLKPINTFYKNNSFVMPKDINKKVIDNTSVDRSRKEFQAGGKLKFLQPTSDKLPEGYRFPYSDPSTERAGTIGGDNGEPAYLVPNFKYGHPIYDPVDEFRRTGEHLGGPFKTWQEADKWESETRHPAVEKGEKIMFPQEKFAMGGSIPGSVGFTYARTQGIPSNGPYAKKTMASAQNGQEMQYYREGLDWKPKTISRDGGWLNQYEDGGIVKGDQDGYRNPKNRGKVVEILGDEMGTDGYNDTLYVVPDVGEPRIVYANTGNHKFPGASKFTEYPVAQNGLRQEQKSLQNLDNLVNFTNYNNKQPGGWLDQI